MGNQQHMNYSRLVVVDPQLDDYRCLVKSAWRQSVRLTLTSTGGNALRLVPSFADAVWLVSPRLPDMDGFDLLEMLHSLQHGMRTVVIDDSYDPRRECRALESRAMQYVCKPLQPEWVAAWTGKPVQPAVPAGSQSRHQHQVAHVPTDPTQVHPPSIRKEMSP